MTKLEGELEKFKRMTDADRAEKRLEIQKWVENTTGALRHNRSNGHRSKNRRHVPVIQENTQDWLRLLSVLGSGEEPRGVITQRINAALSEVLLEKEVLQSCIESALQMREGASQTDECSPDTSVSEMTWDELCQIRDRFAWREEQ